MKPSLQDLERTIAELEQTNRTLRAQLDSRNDEYTKLTALLGKPQDIAERNHTEDELRAANRALRAISDCNQALMRMPNERELLETVCRIVVQAGGYRYAWVGYAEHDAERTIRPVAQSGFPPGFLETMRVSWGDSERGRGSTATAIRTALPSVVQDLQNNPRFAPWRQHAIELGQQAAISLPLIDNNEVFGALTIYAADPQAFNDAETKLLMELAGDLSYGIVSAHTREALQNSEMRLLLALDSAHMGTWDWDLADKIIWSPQHEAILGVAHKPHHGYQEFFERLHPDDSESVEKAIAHSREAHTVFSHEFRIVRPDGSIRWVNARGQFTYGADNKAVRMLGVIADVTDNRRLEEQLRQSQKLEAIGTLASGIAHDFNNILSAIVGNIELAQQDIAANHAASVSLQEIHKASRRGRDVVRQILAFSRPEIQQRSRLALGPIVNEAAKLLRATLPAGIELKTSVAPNCPDVYADATQIHQVLVNLYTNAWHAIADHSPSGAGRIDVTLASVQSGFDALPDTVPPGRYIRISIVDTGMGMDEATMQRIFEPFFTTKNNAHGSGLGLAVVHGIVRSHSGIIVVNSKPNEGSRFDVYFPALSVRAEHESSKTKPDSVPHGSGQRILYIDDDESLVFLGVRVLERFGYRVHGYTDPEPALALFTRDPAAFDLIVTDLNMPRMSGLDVVRAARAVRADIPVILASGYVDQPLQQQARQHGVTRVVYKPNSMDELGKTIHDLILDLNSTP